MLCKQCGLDNEPDETLCGRCGYDLTHQDEPVALKRPGESTWYDKPSLDPSSLETLRVYGEPRKTTGTGLRAALGVLVTLVAAIVAVIIFRGSFSNLSVKSGGSGGGIGGNGAQGQAPIASARTPRPRATPDAASPAPSATPGVIAVLPITPSPTLPPDMEVVIAAVSDGLFHKEGCALAGEGGAHVTVEDALKLNLERCAQCLPEGSAAGE